MVVAGILFAGGAVGGGGAHAGEARHWGPEELWRGVDVEQLPLEAEVTKTWEEDGCVCQKLTFVSEVAEGTKVRIFAMYGAPKGGKNLPGILHIHGGGQTASLAWVEYWAKRGYACATFDFCGKWENRREYTDWGPLAKTCEMRSSGVYEVHPTPRRSGWFHWALAARRALTLLAQEPEVDRDRLGIFGISVGGTLCWLVAGADERVKTAVPIYGCGYNYDFRKAVYGLAPSLELQIWQEAISPEAHAPFIRCPVFFLSASNDHHGWMDDSADALGAVRAPTRQAYTPRYIHHIEPEQGADLQPWMDWHLKGGRPFPESPALELGIDAGGVLQARVRPQEPEAVERVVVYCALGMKIPPSRFWRRVDGANGESGIWTAALPVMSVWDRASVYANVFYRSGVCLSTKISKTLPGQLGRARATLAPSLAIELSGDDGWFFGPAYTDPNIDRPMMSPSVVGERRCVGVNPAGFGEKINFTIASHVFGDPQFQGPAGAVLAFDCRGGFETNGLTLSFSEGEWMPGGVEYKAKVSAGEANGGWKTVLVPLSKFVSDKGASPRSWAKVDRIQISGVTPRNDRPFFSRFRWVMP